MQIDMAEVRPTLLSDQDIVDQGHLYRPWRFSNGVVGIAGSYHDRLFIGWHTAIVPRMLHHRQDVRQYLSGKEITIEVDEPLSLTQSDIVTKPVSRIDNLAYVDPGVRKLGIRLVEEQVSIFWVHAQPPVANVYAPEIGSLQEAVAAFREVPPEDMSFVFPLPEVTVELRPPQE